MELSMGQLVAYRCMQFIHWACVQYRWRCVSLEEKAHLGRPLVWGFGNTNNSLYKWCNCGNNVDIYYIYYMT